MGFGASRPRNVHSRTACQIFLTNILYNIICSISTHFSKNSILPYYKLFAKRLQKADFLCNGSLGLSRVCIENYLFQIGAAAKKQSQKFAVFFNAMTHNGKLFDFGVINIGINHMRSIVFNKRVDEFKVTYLAADFLVNTPWSIGTILIMLKIIRKITNALSRQRTI